MVVQGVTPSRTQASLTRNTVVPVETLFYESHPQSVNRKGLGSLSNDTKKIFDIKLSQTG